MEVKKINDLLKLANKCAEAGLYTGSISLIEKLRIILEEENPESYKLVNVYKNLAFYYSLDGNKKKALEYLEKMRNHESYEEVLNNPNSFGYSYEECKELVENNLYKQVYKMSLNFKDYIKKFIK